MSEETLFELIGGPEDGQQVMLLDEQFGMSWFFAERTEMPLPNPVNHHPRGKRISWIVGDCQYLFVESVSLLNVSFEEDQPYCPRFTKLKYKVINNGKSFPLNGPQKAEYVGEE